MAATLKSLGLDGLSPEEKLAIAGQLWDSVIASAPPGSLLSDEQRAELQRRVADAEANPGDYVTWDEALAETRKRLAK